MKINQVKKTILFFILIMTFVITGFCFANITYAELPTPTQNSQSDFQTGSYNPTDIQISLNTTQKAEYVDYYFDSSQNTWMISSSAIGLGSTPVNSNLSDYYNKMKNNSWTGTFSYSDVNNYEIITNNLKNKNKNDGLSYLLTELKTDAAEDLSYMNTDQRIVLAREIKLNPSNYTIVNGKLQVGTGANGDNTSTSTAAGTTQQTPVSTSTFFSDTTSGGDLSLPGGINISKPSSVKIGSLSVAYTTIFNAAIGISGTIFVVMLLVGGFQYLVSQGKDEDITKAKRLLFDSVIGIVIVAIAWGVGTYVLSSLKIGSSTQGTTTLPQTIPTSTPFSTPLPTGTIIETPEQFPGLPSPAMIKPSSDLLLKEIS